MTGQAGLPGECCPSRSISLVAPVALPMQLTTNHIFPEVRVNGSRPLSFILDSGDKYGLIDIDLAKELSVPLGMAINIAGIGAATTQGAIVNRTPFTLDALRGFTQPITLAMPLRRLAPRFGRDVDGILGADFMSEFVDEIDYQNSVVRLHDKDTFVYSGAGMSVPVQLDNSGHPAFDAIVTPRSGAERGRTAANRQTRNSSRSTPHGRRAGVHCPRDRAPVAGARGCSNTVGRAQVSGSAPRSARPPSLRPE
ncbi:MAG: aspartyl protease family protein [Vicinamibacteria bacterium]